MGARGVGNFDAIVDAHAPAPRDDHTGPRPAAVGIMKGRSSLRQAFHRLLPIKTSKKIQHVMEEPQHSMFFDKKFRRVKSSF